MERAQQAAERAAERARQAAERARDKSDDSRSDSNAASSSASSSPSGSASSNASASSSASSNASGNASSSPPSTASSSGSGSSGSNAGSASSSDKSAKNSDSSDSKSAKSDRRNDSSAAAVKDEPPPATLAEFFKRLSGSSDTTTTGTAKPAEGAAKPTSTPSPVPATGQTTPTQTAPAAGTTAAKPRPALGPLQFPPVGSPLREVLAVNPTRKTLEEAERLKFRITRSTSLPALGLNITQLVPPDTMDPVTAQQFLSASITGSSFALNRRYRPFRAASGAKEKVEPPINRSGEGGCAGERCFGPQIIGWKPELAACTKGVKIGVIDTPVDHRHPAFERAHVSVGTFLAKGQKPAAPAHGTGVLALLAGAAHSTTPGLVPEAEFFVGDIFYVDEEGQASADTVSLLKALDWMDRWEVKVVNLSVAGPHDPLMQQAIEISSRNGTIFIAAAGNDGPEAPAAYPAAYHDVIAVTAVGRDKRGYRHANRGAYIDLAAPGVEIWTALPGSRESFQSGTSFAVPFATAVLATVTADSGVRRKEDLLNRVRYVDLGAPGRDPVYGRGLIVAPERCGPGRAPDPNPPAVATTVATSPVPSASKATSTATAAPTLAPSGLTSSPLWAPNVSYSFSGSRP